MGLVFILFVTEQTCIGKTMQDSEEEVSSVIESDQSEDNSVDEVSSYRVRRSNLDHYPRRRMGKRGKGT